jgi:hypothetical protein
LFVAVCVLCALSAAGWDEYPVGVILPGPDSVEGPVEVTDIPVRPGGPCADSVIHVDLSGQLPPVGSQRGMSCLAWALSYYHRTQLEWVERQWDLTDPRHQGSPMFVYNLLNAGMDRGITMVQALGLMCRDGVTSVEEFPTTAPYWQLPGEDAFWQAMMFRVDSACYIGTYDTVGLNLARRLLANGYTCAFVVECWENFMEVEVFRNIYCLSQVPGNTNLGSHAVTIVGYDDTLTTADGPGAFRLVNQWGTGWGDSGFCWISYIAAMNRRTSWSTAWFFADRDSYRPTLVARVHVSHPRRRSVRFRVGVGSRRHPRWEREFPRGSGSQDDSFPGDDIVCDISDAESLLNRGQQDSVFVACLDNRQDSMTGVVTEFQVEYLPTGHAFVSSDPPVAMADSGDTAFARASVALTGIGERPSRPRSAGASPTVVRGVLVLRADGRRQAGDRAELLDAGGRKVMGLRPGANDVRHLPAGIYFVRELSAVSGQPPAVAKVVISR